MEMFVGMFIAMVFMIFEFLTMMISCFCWLFFGAIIIM